jgi:hypothetical protein
MTGTKHTYTVQMNRVIFPKYKVASNNIGFYTIKCYISFELTCVGAVNSIIIYVLSKRNLIQ